MTPLELLQDAIDETGVSLKLAQGEMALLLAQEGIALTAAVNEPGFAMVLRASRDRVALELGVDASMEARAADARIVGVLQSVLLGAMG